MQYPGVIDIDDDSRPGKWEYQIRVKPEAEAMGVSLADLAGTVRASYYGEEVMRLQRGRHEVKLMVRYPQEERRSVATLNDVRVTSPDGVKRPLDELAEIEIRRGYSEINRLSQKRSITVVADIDVAKSSLTSGQITGDMEKRLDAGFVSGVSTCERPMGGRTGANSREPQKLGSGFYCCSVCDVCSSHDGI